MEHGVHLLQFRRDLPLRDAVVFEGPVVEHAQMDMQIHHSRHQGASLGVDFLGALWNLHLAGLADRFDPVALDDDGGVFQDGAAIAVYQRAAGYYFGVRCGHKAIHPIF